ncbi:MAG: hypothetical protein AAGA99_00350 [Actinomycetota bacterium]
MTDAPQPDADSGPGYLLFVCTANICRSPMAEALLRHEMTERGLALPVRSAGFLEEGRPIDRPVQRALRKRGIEAGEHRSSVVDADLLDGAFLVLTMTARHVLNVVDVAGDALPRTFTLREFVALAESSGGLDPEVDLEQLTASLHERRDRQALMAVDTPFDIADPYGKGRRAYDRAAKEIGTEIERLASLLVG